MEWNSKQIKKDRIFYLDYLRVFATLGVVILHISASNWYHVNVRTFEWQVFSAGDSIVRWSVPIFVMISGALFLGDNISIEKLYKKYIFRIITAFIFWSTIYAIVDIKEREGVADFLFQVINGHYHMWFMFMIVGLYLIVPLIKNIISSQLLTRYFLIISFVFTIFIPQVLQLIRVIDNDLGNGLGSIVGNVHFHFALEYVFYFVLGFYLSKENITKNCRTLIYIMSMIGFAATAGITSFASIYTNEPQGALYGDFTINVMLESMGVFVFFKYVLGEKAYGDRTKGVIIKLSKYSFGVYLVHALIIEKLNSVFGINTLMFNPLLSIVLITVIVIVVSLTISYVCNHIPFLNRYIV